MKENTILSDEYQITDKEKDKKKDRNITLHFKKLEMIRDLKSKLDDKENMENSEEYLIYGLTTYLFENKVQEKKGIIYLNEKEELSLIFLDLTSKIKTKIKLSKLSDIILGKKSGNFIVCEEKVKNKFNEENCLTMQMKDKKKFYDLIFQEKKDLNIFCLGVISIMEKNIKELNNLKRDIINLKQIWKQYVSDNDKKHLNFEQFSMFLRTISFKWKKKTDEQIFNEIDVKKERKINFKDFISFYEFLVTGEEFKEIFQKYSNDEDKKYISIRGLMDFMEKEQHLKTNAYDIFQILNKFSKKSRKILESTGLLNTDIENNDSNQENQINFNKIEKDKKIASNVHSKNLNLNSNLKANLNNEHESLQNIYDNHSFGKNNLLDSKNEDLYSSFCLSFREFVNFLIDKSYNSIYNFDLFPLHQDMNKPLNEYFIHSSHNTYLEGNQMIGNSSIDMYLNVLKNGCRLVELDCWDGKNGPIITHWHFPVNKIELKECLIFIKENAFRKSEYPVIFSIENHCNLINQEMMAQFFIDVIGLENLFIVNTNNPPLAYPSPNDLKRKFIIKCKRKRVLGKKEIIQANNFNVNNKENCNSKSNKDEENNNPNNQGNFVSEFITENNNLNTYPNNFNPDSILVKNSKNYFKQNSQLIDIDKSGNITNKNEENLNSNLINNLPCEENNKNIQWMVQKEEIIEEVNSNNTLRNTINEDHNIENLLDSSNENMQIETEKFISKDINLINDIKENLYLNRNLITNFKYFNTTENFNLKKSSSGMLLKQNFNNKTPFDLEIKKGINMSETFERKNEEKTKQFFENEINNEKSNKNKSKKDDLIYIPEDINKNISLSSTDFTSKNNKNFKKRTQINNKENYNNKNEKVEAKENNLFGKINSEYEINNSNKNLYNSNVKDENKEDLINSKKKEKKKKLKNNIEIEKGSLKNINHTGILNNKFNNEEEDSISFDKKNAENTPNKKDEIAVKIKYLPENKELKFKNLNVEIKDPPLNFNNNQENENVSSQVNYYDVYKIKTKKKKENKSNQKSLNKSLESEISDPTRELQVSQPRNSGKVFDNLKVKYLINVDNNNLQNSELERNKTKENKEESLNYVQTLTNNNNNNHNDYEVLTRMQEIRTMNEQNPSTIKIKTIEKMAKIVGMIGVKYKLRDFSGGLYLPWECVSISEPDFNRYAINIEERIKLIKFCQKSFIKTYPDVVKRTNSTNQDAILSWACGVQIAALNLQKTDDDMILINKIFFKLNGGSKSGYILKPEILRNPNCEEPIKKMTKNIAFKVKFKVLSGFHLHLCFPEKTKITGLYVEVSLRSAYNSEDNFKLITNTIENNYLHPIWISSSVHFEVYDPDLSFIIIKIFSKKKSVVARSVIPVKFMNLGIRIVDLYDNYCSKFENSFLIVKCNKINQ